MKLRVLKYLIGVVGLSLLCTCGHSTKANKESQEHIDTIMELGDNEKDSMVNLFGVRTARDSYAVLMNLTKAGIFNNVDSVTFKDGKFDYAMIEFGGVEIVLNRGLAFLTTYQDRKTINSLVN